MDQRNIPDPSNPESAREARQKSWLPVTLAMSLLVAALVFPLAVTYLNAPELLSCDALTRFQCAVSWMRDLGAWGVLISLLSMTIAALTIFPSEATAMANGAVYGAVWGSLLSWTGAMIGANITFAAARAIGPHAIGLLLSRDHYARIRAWTDSSGHLALLTARLIPLFPYFAVNYTAGLIGMRWWPFNWVSAIGMAPAAITFTTMGAKAGEMSWLNWAATVIGIIVALILIARCVSYLCTKPAAADPEG